MGGRKEQLVHELVRLSMSAALHTSGLGKEAERCLGGIVGTSMNMDEKSWHPCSPLHPLPLAKSSCTRQPLAARISLQGSEQVGSAVSLESGSSTERQRRSGLGIEAQRATVTKFAETERFTIEAEFVEAETGSHH